ncbi:MAG: hypothetical protein V4722_09640 [Bacteroidota bacterium]
MKTLLLISGLFAATFAQAQYGIGTTNPSPNAALDVTSTNKGLMLPRLGDTTAVTGPTAGLVIFNNKTKRPTFHNGTSWKSMARLEGTNTIDPNADSIVYFIGPNSAGLAAGPFPVESFATGGSAGEERFTANIVVPWHINSIGLQKQFMQKTILTGQLEVRIFKRGAATASYTYKFTNLTILANSFGHSDAGLPPGIAYSIWADKLSYKDVVNNSSFGWSYVAPMGLTTY